MEFGWVKVIGNPRTIDGAEITIVATFVTLIYRKLKLKNEDSTKNRKNQ